MTDNRAIVVLSRMAAENPEAFQELIDWIDQRRHAFEITLQFHGGRFQGYKFSTGNRR